MPAKANATGTRNLTRDTTQTAIKKIERKREGEKESMKNETAERKQARISNSGVNYDYPVYHVKRRTVV